EGIQANVYVYVSPRAIVGTYRSKEINNIIGTISTNQPTCMRDRRLFINGMITAARNGMIITQCIIDKSVDKFKHPIKNYFYRNASFFRLYTIHIDKKILYK